MTLETLGIPIAFTIIAVILLWGILGSKGWWWLKMIAISVTIFFAVAVEESVSTYLGWSTKDAMPDLYLIHWVEVQEPIKSNSEDKGAIYIWVRDIDYNKNKEEDAWHLSFLDYNSTKKEPRSYMIPYTKNKHAKAKAMQEGIKKGKKYIGGAKAKAMSEGKGDGKGDGDGKGKGKGKGDGKGKGNGVYQYDIDQELHFYELPPPMMPRKDPEQSI